MQTIYDILLANSTLLELYKSQGLTDTQISLQNALELINKRIEKTQGKWTTQKLNAIKKLIEDEIAKSYGGLFASMQSESTAIAQITYNSIVGASMSAAIPTALMNDLTSSTRLIQGYEFKELFKLTQENHARQLRVSLASAIGAGMTPTQITQELNKKNESLTKAQLATNVRTVIFNAANEASYKSYAKLEKDGFIDYYEYVAVLDSRTSEICRNNDGRKFYQPIDEITTKPDLHFNCRSKLVPRNKYSRQDGTRASQFGAVPSNETYSTWFARQPSAYQKNVLGPTKYNAYKSGVYKIGGLPDVLGKPLSLQQVSDVMEEFVATPKVPVIDFGYDGKFNKYVEDIRDEAKIVIDKLPKPKIKLNDRKIAYYDGDSINLMSYDLDKSVFLHEYGHHIDKQIGFKSDKFIGAIDKDLKNININKLAEEVKLIGYDVKKIDTGRRTKEKLSPKDKDTILFSDTLDSITKGKLTEIDYRLDGHGANYYQVDGYDREETFANLFSLWSSNSLYYKELKKIIPNTVLEFETILTNIK